MKKITTVILCLLLCSCQYFERKAKCERYTDSADKYLQLYVSNTSLLTHYMLMGVRATSSEVNNFGNHAKVNEYYKLGMKYHDTFAMYKIIVEKYHDETYRYLDSANKYNDTKK